MTILAFGCSIMHGAETVTGHQNVENTKYSYAQLIANHMSVDCVNYGVCGQSNEGIFHSFFDNVSNHKDITFVLVGWTSHVREYWYGEGRHWFVIPSWCSTTTDINNPSLFFNDYVDENINLNPRVCADKKEYIDILSAQYKFLMQHKFDIKEYAKKTTHYIKAVRGYCASHNIKLIETCAMMETPVSTFALNIDKIGSWRQTLGHPTRDDHQQIANRIIETYKL